MAEIPPRPTITSPAEGAVVGPGATISGTCLRGATVTVTATTKNIPLLGLGTSVGTPPDGVDGDVWVVKTFEELAADPGRVQVRVTQTTANGTSAEASRTFTVQRP
ncbi:hypothetical protein [Nocardia sp. NPDC057440]|uniref:hypothetical protein n=1 Tax=Nocardia sp. NPDC057440 TaxID=3346134 RepID=UPI0036720CF7